MIREQILEAIRAATAEIGRVPGEKKFYKTSTVARGDLRRAGFSKYSEAVKAAGLEPNQLQSAYDSEAMLTRLAVLCRKLGRFPSISDLEVARHDDQDLPSYDAYKRVGNGSYPRVKQLLLEFCRRKGWRDIVPLLEDQSSPSSDRQSRAGSGARVTGYVYLVKMGKDYKIGRSNDVARRRREISLLLPQEVEHVHIIETDDPAGIEKYWHERFRERHVNGEWYRLTSDDVSAFRRRRYQ